MRRSRSRGWSMGAWSRAAPAPVSSCGGPPWAMAPSRADLARVAAQPVDVRGEPGIEIVAGTPTSICVQAIAPERPARDVARAEPGRRLIRPPLHLELRNDPGQRGHRVLRRRAAPPADVVRVVRQ